MISTEKAKVHFVGVLPPPVSGMPLLSQAMVDRLAAKVPIEVFDLSSQSSVSMLWKIRKALRAFRSAAFISTRPHRKGTNLYMPVDARWGMIYNILLGLACRLAGCGMFLHHHSFSYIDRPGLLFMILTRICGSAATHIVGSPLMDRKFRDVYPAARTMVLQNEYVLSGPPGSVQQRASSDPLRIGHISNLTIQKGFDLVLATFGRLHEENKSVKLIIAGPLASKHERVLLEDATRRFGSDIEYRGPVYDGDKLQFFRDIDIKLFPTQYRVETYPVVLVEAMHFGVPVIAYGRGCIPDILGNEAGLVVEPDADFVEAALPLLREWATDAGSLSRASKAASARSAKLRAEAQQQLNALLNAITKGS